MKTWFKSKGIFFVALMVFMALFAVSAFAGILEVIGTTVKTVASSGSLWVGLGALVLVYILKAVPNQKIYGLVNAFFKRLGIVMTLGLTKWKWSAPFWQNTVEVWFIDILQNTVKAAIDGFIAGLRTDNTNGG